MIRSIFLNAIFYELHLKKIINNKNKVVPCKTFLIKYIVRYLPRPKKGITKLDLV